MVIQVTNLNKRFGEITAVENISFHVKRGSSTALLGSNGAGKTTTLAMLLGLLLPTHGQITILNKDILKFRHQIQHRINFTSPYVDLPGRLSVMENLSIYARLYAIPKRKHRIAELANELELNELLKRPYRTLSAGQKTRTSLAKALLNKPEILFLDEPTASLDPDSGDRIRGYLQAYQKKYQSTFLLASHNMVEVERLCQDVLIMQRGQLIHQGSPKQLRDKFGLGSLEDVFLDVARKS